MFIPDLPAQTASALLAVPDSRTDTVDDLDGVDVSPYVGNMAVDAMFEAIATGTTKTVTLTFEHNDVADGDDAGWSAIDPDALVDPETGDPAAFPVVGVAAYHERLALVKALLKPFVRAVLTCGSADVVHLGAVLLTAQRRRANA